MAPSAPSTLPPGASPSTRLPVAAVADLISVVVFVLLGRRAHDEGTVLTGTLTVAWPFLTGTALGWAGVLVRRVHPASMRAGVAIVVATVAVGMTLRHLTGGGVQASFIAVASTFLALFLLGWRALAARRRA
ncbi:MAG: DUF3054 domain-containing protein [Kineosporiaceae bacterium]|nr:DUF3054 domain-containing protein [Kineosporiaceae bacterium]